MLAGVAVIVLAGVLVLGNGKDGENGSAAATTTPSATSASTATTTIDDLFSQPPIIPEAKVSTEGWKTCRNEEYGYEFKFPGEWHIYGEDALSEPNPHPISKRVYVRESEECNGAHVMLSTVVPWNGTVATSGDGGMHVTLTKMNTHNIPINQEFYWRDFYSRTDAGLVLQPYLVDEQYSVMRVSGHVRNDGSRHWAVWLLHNEYEISISGGFFEAQSPALETILSTFRFLNTTSTTNSK